MKTKEPKECYNSLSKCKSFQSVNDQNQIMCFFLVKYLFAPGNTLLFKSLH